MTDDGFSHRIAAESDNGELRALMDAAIPELLAPYLSPEQVTASFSIMGLDTQLIADRTYFVIAAGTRIVGAGGWSRRATLFGGDHSSGRDGRLLDPSTEPARVRAMYTHPAFARRGIGRLVLGLCEAAAMEEGFSRAELAATMSGLPLYRACGYRDVETLEVRTPSGVMVPIVRMTKTLAA
jgi:GNAT superfamily N-acetyltransferase